MFVVAPQEHETGDGVVSKTDGRKGRRIGVIEKFEEWGSIVLVIRVVRVTDVAFTQHVFEPCDFTE
jgi:hypothetical protein